MKRLLTVLLCALLVLLCACGDAGGEAMLGFAPPEDMRLTVYTSHKEEVYGPIIKEFQERTGIWVRVVTGGTGELLDQIESERGEPRCDVMFGGGVESLSAYADCFEVPEGSADSLLRPGLHRPGDTFLPFSSLPIVLIYNTKLVSPGELSGWADLLDSRWQGRIAFADPSVSGSSYTAAITMLQALGGDRWENLTRFSDNLADRLLPSSGDVIASVAAGDLAVGVTLEETALQRKAQGADIAIVYPAEGTSILPDGTALVAGAPHRDNALRFLDFVQSADVQNLVVSRFARRTVRADVSDRADLPPVEEIPVIDYDVDAASALKSEFLQRWREIREEAAP